MPVIVLRHAGVRAAPFAAVTAAELYATCLEQAAWADRQGFDVVSLAEHHGVTDGYLPAPLTLAAAVAARTARIGVTVAVILPLHDPVRLAEQGAVLNLVSCGRVRLTLVPGYREAEFDMAGVDRSQRGRLLEEYVGVLRQAWSGEPFTWRGRTIRVTPAPQTTPMLAVGGATPAAARRAARLRLPFHAAVDDPQLAAVYAGECRRVGFAGAPVGGGSATTFVHVTRNPERDWTRIAPYALYDAHTYAVWGNPGTTSSPAPPTAEDLRRGDRYRVVTPDEAVRLARETGSLILEPLMGGMPLELGWSCLELVASEVVPRLR